MLRKIKRTIAGIDQQLETAEQIARLLVIVASICFGAFVLVKITFSMVGAPPDTAFEIVS